MVQLRNLSLAEGGARPRISDPTSQISLKLLMNVTKGPLDAPRAPEFFLRTPRVGVGVVPPWPENPDLKKFIEFFSELCFGHDWGQTRLIWMCNCK